jgi:hypothetical protein
MPLGPEEVAKKITLKCGGILLALKIIGVCLTRNAHSFSQKWTL